MCVKHQLFKSKASVTYMLFILSYIVQMSAAVDHFHSRTFSRLFVSKWSQVIADLLSN